MKVVLKDMIQSENLSSYGLNASREALENTNKFNEYFIDNQPANKLYENEINMTVLKIHFYF